MDRTRLRLHPIAPGCLLWVALWPSLLGAMPASGTAGPADSTVVGNTGAASWSIPIPTPPGPGGHAPSLALTYSSHAGDGPLGVGWRLPLGEIRCSARHGVPGSLRPDRAARRHPRAIACPRFELDGELLNYNAAENRYHTFVESFQRIVHLWDDRWEVTTPDGVKRRYGASENSRVRGPSGNVARWLLAEIENPYGQKIVFEYDSDPSDASLDDAFDGSRFRGTTYIRRIRYGPGAQRVVHFEYEPRPDPIRDFAGGVERRLAHRLREIRVESQGGHFGRHLLGYDLADLGETPAAADYTTRRSRLAWVQVFGSDCAPPADPLASCVGLPARQFRYTDPADASGPQWEDVFGSGGFDPPILQNPSRWPPHWAPASSQLGDVNGDGLPDVVSHHTFGSGGNQGEVWLNTGSAWVDADGDPADPRIDLAARFTESFRTLAFPAPRIDVTLAPGDAGRHTICAAQASDVSQAVKFRGNDLGGFYAELPVQYEVFANGGGGVPAPDAPFVQVTGDFRLVDLNADRRADLVMSLRVQAVHRTHDCSGAPLPGGPVEAVPARELRVAFRNTGDGWVRDDGLVVGLPAFGVLGVAAGRYLESEYGWAEDCPGFLNEHFEDPIAFPAPVYPCVNHAALAPEFADLDGDGRLDLIVAAPVHPDRLVVTNDYEWHELDVPLFTPAPSRAWLSREDGSWRRDPSFDLPFHHAHLYWDDGRSGRSGATTSDAGVRLGDVNRDGYPDVLWRDPLSDCVFSGCAVPWGPGYAPVARGVLLNRGRGDGTSHSAWCASRPLAPISGAVATCSPELAAERWELPDGARFAAITSHDGLHSTRYTALLVDLNGDGWLDLARGRDEQSPQAPIPAAAWLQSPGSTGSAWVEVADGAYDPPVLMGIDPEGDHPTPVASFPIDLNGDGAIDFVRSDGAPSNTHSFVSRRRLPDLLREIRNGRGGRISLAYDTGAGLASPVLEAAAADHADAVQEGPAAARSAGFDDVVLWPPAPLVAAVTTEGPNRAPATARYRYAHPRSCLRHRSLQGFRLVEQTRADGAVVESLYYQHHGRAGRLSRRTLWEDDAPRHSHEEHWVRVDPASVTGAWPGDADSEASHVGRLALRASRAEYGAAPGASPGALQLEGFSYDDVYGYNFVSEVRISRPSTDTRHVALPEAADRAAWILGHVRERRIEDQRSGWIRRTELAYTPEGRLARETRHRDRRDGSPPPAPAVTEHFYDGFGNPIRRVDPRGHATEYCFDTSPPAHTWCAEAPGGDTASVRVARRDPGIGGAPGQRTFYTPDPVFGIPLETASEYADVPTTSVVLDPFGREIERWVTPRGGTPVRVASASYRDHHRVGGQRQPHVERLAYADAAGSFVRSVSFGDGFGGVWKTVRDAGGAPPRYVGVATYHDPATRTSRTTYDLSCGASALCEGLGGATEHPATVTWSDANGRPVQVDTPDGRSRFGYAGVEESIALAAGRVEARAVDVVYAENARGDLVRRSLDGRRLLAVEECANDWDPDAPACHGGGAPHRTLYGHHASGQLEVVYDVRAVLASDWSNPRHQLRYHFDAEGRVVRVDDPDAGTGHTYHDAAGNVVARFDARGEGRAFLLDELDRPTRILSSQDAPVAIGYRDAELQRHREDAAGHGKVYAYDGLGRLLREETHTSGATLETHHAYDGLGRPTRIEYPSERVAVLYEYEGAYLRRVCHADPLASACSGADRDLISDVGYDELGRRRNVWLPGGVRTYGYATRAANPAEETRHLEVDAFLGPNVALRHEYTTRDALGNVLSWSSETTPGGLGGSGSYAYDRRNRIASWTRSGSGTELYAYDDLGNRVVHRGAVQEFLDPLRPHAVSRRGTAVHAYDAAGNLASVVDTAAPGSDRHYGWDTAGRLVCVGATAGGCERLSVAYDADGRRILEQSAVSGTTRRFHGDTLTRIEDAAGARSRIEVFAFGERVAQLEVAGGAAPVVTPRWLLSDPLGSGVAVLDRDGVLRRHTRFAPFGAVDGEAPAASAEGRRVFAGHPEQEETGLLYMQARWMSPATGSFLSVDPLIRPSDPQSHTGYAYARNNPISHTDPTGMYGCLSCGAHAMLMGAGEIVHQASTTYTVRQGDVTREVTVVEQNGQVVRYEGSHGAVRLVKQARWALSVPGFVELGLVGGPAAGHDSAAGPGASDAGTELAGKGTFGVTPRPPPAPPPGPGRGTSRQAALLARIPGYLARALGFRRANARLEREIGSLRGLARDGVYHGLHVAAFKAFVVEHAQSPLGGPRVADSNLVVFEEPAGDLAGFVGRANAFARGQGAIGPSGPLISSVVIGPIRIAGPPPRL